MLMLNGYIIYYGPGREFVADFAASCDSSGNIKSTFTAVDSFERAAAFINEFEAQAVANLLRINDPAYGGLADDRDIFKALPASEAHKL